MNINTKMVGRSAYTVEIQSYIKNSCILGKGCKDIFDEICFAYGHNEMSFLIVIPCFKKFKCGLVSTKDAPHCLSPKTAISAKMVARVKEIVATDAIYTTRQTPIVVGISLGAAHIILKCNLKMKKI